MWLFHWNLNNIKRVFAGKRRELTCQNCGKKATFHEATAEDRVAAYVVIELWKRTKRVMQCGECLAVCDYYEMFPEEKAQEAQFLEEQKRKQLEAKAAEEEKRKLEEQKELKKQEDERLRLADIEAKRRAAERVQKEKVVDDELAALKKQLGKE